MRPDQLELVYGSNSPYNNSAAFERFRSLFSQQHANASSNYTSFRDALKKDIMAISRLRRLSVEPQEKFVASSSEMPHQQCMIYLTVTSSFFYSNKFILLL